MMKLFFTTILFSLISNFTFAQDNYIEIGKKYSFQSIILNEERFFNIYLPPSYHSSELTKYPVIYLMDGDYNFHHTTGLIEQLSSISEKIPEMIVVGISDRGRESYIKNCTPFNEEKNKNGQLDKFLNFLTTELREHIEQNYRTSKFDILIGHSIAGLFTINALLNDPFSFNVFIAISPSLWWNDYETEKKIAQFFEKYDSLNRHLFLSLGNEKGMGVLGFINQLDINTFADEYYKNKPLGLLYNFTQYPNENHNSVGLVTVDNALKELFSNYDISTSTLNNLQTFSQYEELHSNYIEMIADGFRFPNRQLNIILNSFYKSNSDEIVIIENELKNKYPASLPDFYNNLGNILVNDNKLEEGVDLLKKSIVKYPNSSELITSLANAYSKTNQPDQAKIYHKKSYDVAIKNGSRNWHLNQLRANFKKAE